MSPETRREAMLAFGVALDKLRQSGAPVSEQTAEVLKLYFLSGVSWGLDHAWMEKKRQILLPH